MNEFTTYAKKYGTVTFDGKTYALKRDAELSNRVFSGWFGDAQEGEEYIVEFDAPALGEDGEDYIICWQFTDIKGYECGDCGDYPWQDVYDVNPA